VTTFALLNYLSNLLIRDSWQVFCSLRIVQYHFN